MRLRRNEIQTGLFVLITFAGLFLLYVRLGAKGMIEDRKAYQVFIDNAVGMRTGATVQLAGRKIGEVIALDSPVAKKDRPADHPEFEVLITLEVEEKARIYNDVEVLIQQGGLLGDAVVDFRNGDEDSGAAAPGTRFNGRRAIGASEAISSAATSAEITLKEAQKTLSILNGLAGSKGSLRSASDNINQMTDTLKREPWRLLWKNKKEYDEKDAKPPTAPR